MKQRLFVLHTSFIFCFMLSGFSAFASFPVISGVTGIPSNGQVPRYSKYELDFSVAPSSHENVYDPSSIDVYAIFTSPSGTPYRINGFYYSGYTSSSSNQNPNPFPFDIQTLTPTGTSSWKIRFTPNELGNWQFKIYATNTSASSIYPSSGTLSITCTSSSTKGFIVKANKRYMKYSTGEFFFPVGENVAWFGRTSYRGPYEYGTNELKAYMDQIALNNGNFMRLWLDYYEALALIGWDFTNSQMYNSSSYNQGDAWQLDEVMEYARQKGIYIELCLFSHVSWGDESYSFNNWTLYNPFNAVNGGPLTSPYDLFTDATAINEVKRLSRYIVARWGYSPNIMSWELWNEVNQVDELVNQNSPYVRPLNYSANVINWHIMMYNYIKSVDPYDHLISTSFAGDVQTSYAVGVDQAMDYTQSHDYNQGLITSSATDYQAYLASISSIMTGYFEKPHKSGEWGFHPSSAVPYDPKGVEIHNSLWSTAFSGSFSAANPYFWDYIHPQNLYFNFSPVSVFMNSQPVLDEVEIQANGGSPNGLYIYSIRNGGYNTIMGWVQDFKFKFQQLRVNNNNYLTTLNPSLRPAPFSSNNTFQLTVDHPGNYLIKWYSAETGLLYGTQTATATMINQNSNSSNLLFTMPLALRTSTYGDAVFVATRDCNQNQWNYDNISWTTGASNVFDYVVCNPQNSQVFYRTSGNKIQSMWWNATAGQWQWSDMGNVVNNCAGPIVVAPNGSLVYRTTTNSLNMVTYNTTTSTWQVNTMNGAASSNVGNSVVIAPNGQIFYRTINNNINSAWYNSSVSQWQWTGLNNAANGIAGGDMAVSPIGQVFFRTTTGGLSQIWYNGSSWVLSNLNGAATSGVAGSIAVTPNGQVFYRTTSNAINSAWYDNSINQWQWSGLNNAATGNVAGGLATDATGKVFYITTGNAIQCIFYSGSQWYGSTLDYSCRNDAFTPLTIDNMGRVYFKGADNNVKRIFYGSQCFNGPGNTFFRLGSPIESEETPSTISRDGSPAMKVYPVPSDGGFTIELPEGKTADLIEMYTMDGKMVHAIAEPGKQVYTIATNELPYGVYLLRTIYTDGTSDIQKIAVAH